MPWIPVATAIVVAVAIVFLGMAVLGLDLLDNPWTGVAGVAVVVAGSILLARHWFMRRVTVAVVAGIVLTIIGMACSSVAGYGRFAIFLPIPIALVVMATRTRRMLFGEAESRHGRGAVEAPEP